MVKNLVKQVTSAPDALVVVLGWVAFVVAHCINSTGSVGVILLAVARVLPQ